MAHDYLPRKVRKNIKTCQQRRSHHRRETIRLELQQGWCGRFLSQAWRAAYALGGKKRGPKHRVYHQLPSYVPDVNEWSEYLGQKGSLGGCEATHTTWCTAFDEYHDEPFCEPGWDDNFLAKEDLKNTVSQLRKGTCRRGVQPGDVPVEIWKILLFYLKNQKSDDFRGGVGNVDNNCIFQGRGDLNERMHRIHAVSRKTLRPPLRWHCSYVWLLPKNNNKLKCASMRLIHGLQTYSKAFYAGLWKSQDVMPDPQHEFASAGKRREEAITAQCVMSHKLTVHNISHFSEWYDASNAFPSTSHSAIIDVVSDAKSECDATFFILHVVAAMFNLTAQGVTQLFAAGSGIFAGGSIARQMFGAVYTKCVDTWSNITAEGDKMLNAVSPLTGKVINCSITTFVDDIGKKRTVNADHIVDEANFVRSTLRNEVQSAGIDLNVDKSVIQVSLFGTGAMTRQRHIFNSGKVGQVRVTPEARYLGPYLNTNGTASQEVPRRIRATAIAWYTLIRFWYERIDLPFKLLVFRSVVVGTMLSGMVSFALSRSAYARLQSPIAKYARKLLRGRACVKVVNSQGVRTFQALSNVDVLKECGIAPIHVELAVQRLTMYQNIARDCDKHDLYITCMFGHFPFERLEHSFHPWKQQMVNDVELLRPYDEFAHFIDQLCIQPILLFQQGECNTTFCNFDLKVLRVKFTSVCTPPPGHCPPEIDNIIGGTSFMNVMTRCPMVQYAVCALTTSVHL